MQAFKPQEDVRTGDTVDVIFLGLPVSSMSGSNVAPEIARPKGEINAVRRVGMKNSCNLPQPKTGESKSRPRDRERW